MVKIIANYWMCEAQVLPSAASTHFKSDTGDPCEENCSIRLFYQTGPLGTAQQIYWELLRNNPESHID